MKIGDEEISLSATFKRICDNRDEINERIEKLIEQWDKEDDEKCKIEYKMISKMVKK
ncbi:unnamed protein product [marine sediment metagenome]|uniref:Uncharacterized protein n=1 Tax=marine sediment metagenome TaxID=412755 RepID=X1UHP8_9ZZZZ